jgi:hypothetical protein
MIRSNGQRWVSHPTDDEPAPGEKEDKIAMGESVRVGVVGRGRMGRFTPLTWPAASLVPG